MELIENSEERSTLGRNALTALELQRGATARTARALVELMNRPVARVQPAGKAPE
jgi:hypothetical protein